MEKQILVVLKDIQKQLISNYNTNQNSSLFTLLVNNTNAGNRVQIFRYIKEASSIFGLRKFTGYLYTVYDDEKGFKDICNILERAILNCEKELIKQK